VEAAAEDPVEAGEEGDWEVEGAGPPGRWEVQPGAVLDFLATTEVGRRAPAEVDDAVSAVSELELRDWLDEQGAGEEGAGAGGGGGGRHSSNPPPR